MTQLQQLLDEYSESHKNETNKAFHWVCIPLIIFSLFGLLVAIPITFFHSSWLNVGTLVMILALMYYLRFSWSMFFGFLVVCLATLKGNLMILESMGRNGLVVFSISIFVVAWIGQFIGHKIEGKKPSFLKDIQFLLIGPAWLLHFIYKKIGIPYE